MAIDIIGDGVDVGLAWGVDLQEWLCGGECGVASGLAKVVVMISWVSWP